MKPEPLPFTSLASRTGSPAKNGERAIEPVRSAIALPRASRRMKLGLTIAAGQDLPLQVFGLDGLAERNVGLRDQDVDRIQLAAPVPGRRAVGSEPLAR